MLAHSSLWAYIVNIIAYPIKYHLFPRFKCYYCTFGHILHVDHCCGPNVLQLGRAMECFPPLTIQIAPLNYMRASSA